MNDDTFIATMLALLALIFAVAGIAYPTTVQYSAITDIPAIELEHGLCLWLPFDGVVSDKSGYSASGVLNNGVYLSGVFSSCVAFNGVNTSAVISDSVLVDVGLDDATFTFWFMLNDNTTRFGVFKKGTAVNRYICEVHSSIKLRFNVYDGVSDINVYSASTLQADAWYFCAVTLNRDGNMIMYLNCTAVGSTSMLSVATTDFNTADDLVFGLYTAYFDGYVDDFRKYNRVLSDYEISQLYNLGE